MCLSPTGADPGEVCREFHPPPSLEQLCPPILKIPNTIFFSLILRAALLPGLTLCLASLPKENSGSASVSDHYFKAALYTLNEWVEDI